MGLFFLICVLLVLLFQTRSIWGGAIDPKHGPKPPGTCKWQPVPKQDGVWMCAACHERTRTDGGEPRTCLRGASFR